MTVAVGGACLVLGSVCAVGCGFGFGGTSGTGGTTGVASVSSQQTTTTYKLPAGVTVRSLTIETDKLTISTAGAVQQLQVAGLCSDNRVRDLTHAATWTVSDATVATVDANAVAAPKAAGTTTVTATFDGVSATTQLTIAAAAVPTGTGGTSSGPYWNTDAFPLLEQTLSCMQCHTANGAGGSTRLVFSGNSAADYTMVTTSGMIDKANPSASLLVTKPDGTVAHSGGALIAKGGSEANTLTTWIAAGAPQQASSGGGVTAPTPDAVIVNPTVRNLIDASAQQQMVVLAWYRTTGAVIDITKAATYSFSTPGIATADANGIVSVTGNATGTVTVTASYSGVAATSQLAFGSTAALTNGDKPEVIVVPAAGANAPTVTIVSGNTQTGAPGAVLSAPMVVQAKDSTGAPVANAAVTWSKAAGSAGTISASSAKTDANGQAQATFTLGVSAGAATINVTIEGVSVSFTETAVTSTVNIVSGNNQSGLPGATLKPFQVQVKDGTGNPIANTAITFQITSVGGSLAAVSATTDASGNASATMTLPATPTSCSVLVTSGTAAPATFTASCVAPAIAVFSGDKQTGTVGSTLGTALTVSLTGPGTTPIAGATVTFAITSTGGGSLSAAAMTNASGQTSVNLTLPSTPGTVTVTASYTGATGSPATFSATANAGAPASITKLKGDTQNSSTFLPLVVQVKDSLGNALANQTVTFAIASGTGTLTPTSVATDTSGQAGTTLTTTAGAGSVITVNASVAGIAAPVTFTETVSASAAPVLAVVQGDAQTGVTGTALTMSLIASLMQGTSPLAGKTVSISGVDCTPSVTSAVTDTSGNVTFTVTLGATLGHGAAQVTLSYTGATNLVFSETVIGPPVLSYVSGDNQSGAVSTALASPVVVLLKDGAGAAMASKAVSFAVTTGTATLSGATATTNASGQAQVTVTLGAAAGTIKITASYGSSSYVFTATATAAAAPSFATTVWTNMVSKCWNCHGQGGQGVFDMGNSKTSSTSTYTLLTVTNPALQAAPSYNLLDKTTAANSGLILKATSSNAVGGHSGGNLWPVGSAQYNAFIAWVQGGSLP